MKPPVLGIDPGVTGGWALIKPGRPVALGRWAVDGPAGACKVLEYAKSHYVRVAMERVSSSPVQSPKSAFTFGDNFGYWKGMMRMADLSYTLVLPQIWQRPIPGIAAIRIQNLPAATKYRNRKNLIKRYVKTIYPDVTGLVLENSDALAIAHYFLDTL